MVQDPGRRVIFKSVLSVVQGPQTLPRNSVRSGLSLYYPPLFLCIFPTGISQDTTRVF